MSKLDGLSAFRLVLGIWLVLAPWLLPGCILEHRLSGLATGAAVIAAALFAERLQSLRWLQAASGLWVMASAALLAPGPIMIDEIVVGLAVLVTSVVTRDTFQSQ
jgi:hypothetical protein